MMKKLDISLFLLVNTCRIYISINTIYPTLNIICKSDSEEKEYYLGNTFHIQLNIFHLLQSVKLNI